MLAIKNGGVNGLNTYDYDFMNMVNAAVSPSTVHASDNRLTAFYARYLFQKAISVFKWILPETWDADYFLYTLFGYGYIAVFDTEQFGIVCQACGLTGFDVFYRPTIARISNPAFNTVSFERRLRVDAALIKAQPDYHSPLDLCVYYGDMMALAAEAAGVNLINSKLAYVFGSKNKAFAESFKKMFDQINAGNPAVFVDKNLFNDDGSPAWLTFNQDIGSTYIADKLFSDLRKIETMFDTDIGIPNANTDKRERLISDEVNANNLEVACKRDLWLDTMQEGIAEVKKLFPDIRLSVDVRYRGGDENIGNNVNSGAV